jgi:hypothetical protein
MLSSKPAFSAILADFHPGKKKSYNQNSEYTGRYFTKEYECEIKKIV